MEYTDTAGSVFDSEIDGYATRTREAILYRFHLVVVQRQISGSVDNGPRVSNSPYKHKSWPIKQA